MRDNMFREVPEEYFAPCEKAGRLVVEKYETKNYLGNGEAFSKEAYVYLPYGYDENNKYDVFYLMHGGGGNEKDYFGGNVKGSVLKELFDNMIEHKDIKPCIVVAPSYNNPYNDNAAENCRNFHAELVNDLIDAVEGKYSTYYDGNDPEKSRSHRIFGGFSMGAACTWWVFEFALDYFRCFMPISGDSWCKTGGKAGSGTAEYMRDIVTKSKYTSEDFVIYSGCGTIDIAYPNMTPLIEEMKKLSDTFIFGKNLYYTLREGGEHNIETIYRIIYNGLPCLTD